ncbi:MAG: hypothetical protein GX449_01575 [Synergistaceae bacterium]|nr:hypothetical protein [Synergistaceae bacterium]
MDGAKMDDGSMTVGEILKAMSGEDLPSPVLQLVDEIRSWMVSALRGEGPLFSDEEFLYGYDERRFSGDPDSILSRLSWIGPFADLLPNFGIVPKNRDAVVLCLGPMDFDEGMRMAIDHATLFARGLCRRVWLICDSWLAEDVVRYLPHVRALQEQGVLLRVLLVCPWGWVEIPIGKDPGRVPGLGWKNEAKGFNFGPMNRGEEKKEN